MRRIVVPLVATIILVWGLLMLPNMASSTTTQTDDDSVAEPLLSAPSSFTNCEPRALDLYYILDISGSMGQLYGEGSDDNKLDAAKETIAETNELIDSWDNGSRMGLITFHAGDNPSDIRVSNQLGFPPFWPGLTDNLDTFNQKLLQLAPDGGTPTFHALVRSFQDMNAEIISGHVPVFILLSDGVPTRSGEEIKFKDVKVQVIEVRDGAGGFRPSEEVRVDGGLGGIPNVGFFNGEPLADVMTAISAIMKFRPDLTYHAVGIQGKEGNTFNGGILEYVAFMGQGVFAEPENLSALYTALSEAVMQSACSPPVLPDETYSPEECPVCTTREMQNFVGGPINTFSGNYNYEARDLSVPALGYPLTFERTYNSLSITGTAVYSRPLGYGWTHNFDLKLTFPDDSGGELNKVILKAPHGSRMRFYIYPDGSYGAKPHVRATLTRSASPPYIYTVKAGNQSLFEFDENGQLIKMIDPQGNQTLLSYNASELLERVTDSATGHWLEFAYDGQGLITSVTDLTGRGVFYAYQNENLRRKRVVRLVSVTDVRGLPWQYTYQSSQNGSGEHLLHEVIDPARRVVERTFYDQVDRTVRQENGLAEPVVEITYPITAGTRTVTEMGVTVEESYNAQNLLSTQTDASGTRHYSFNDYYSREQVIDKNLHSTHYARHNRFALTTAITDALGQTTSFVYSPQNNLMAMTDADGGTTNYSYDSQNNLLSMSDSLGRTTSYSYNAKGQVLSVTDARGNTTSYDYDSEGNRTAIIDTLGNRTEFEYDPLGRVIRVTDPLGRMTLNEYDAAGNLLRTTQNYLAGESQNHQNEYNLITEYQYDGVGRQTVIIETLGNITRNEYNEAGQLVRTISNELDGQPQNYLDEYNLITTYSYDEVGRQVSVMDTLGHLSLTEYDELGRVARSITNYVDGVYDDQAPDEDLITAFNYDANGNLLSVTDALGRESGTEYDALNRVLRTIVNYQDGIYDPAAPDEDLSTSYQYDTLGNQIAQTDPLGRVTQNEYDAVAQLTQTTNPLGGTSSYAYDEAGNRLSVTDANGHTTEYEYDELNRTVTVIDALGGTTRYEYDALGKQTVVTNALDHSTTTSYDTLNRVQTVTNALGGTSSVTSSPLGRRLRSTDANGTLTAYEYDSLGRLTQLTANVVDGQASTDETNVTTGYTYDALSRRREVTDGNGQSTSYQYDGLGRQIRVIDANGNSTRYNYDGLGNRLSVTNAEQETTYFEYDKASRLLVSRSPLNHETHYSYDGVGNRLAVTDAEGIQTCYGYDRKSRLSQVTENCVPGAPITDEQNVSTEYAYDGVGNRTLISNGLGNATSVMPDELNRSLSETDSLGHTTIAEYDALGNRIRQTDANGALTNFIYDALNRLTEIDYPTGQVDVTFSYDPVGKRLTMNDETGTTTYSYDGLYRLANHTNGAGETVSYAYDKVGNRLQLSHAGNTVSYSYDPLNHLLTVQNESGQYSYAYDKVHRLTSLSFPNGVQSNYAYDAAGRMIGLTHIKAGQTLASYEYQLDKVANRLVVTETLNVPANQMATLRAPDTSFVKEPAQILAETNAYAERKDTQSAAVAAIATNTSTQEASGGSQGKAQFIHFTPHPTNPLSNQPTTPPTSLSSPPTKPLINPPTTHSTDVISQSLETRLWLPFITNGEDPFLAMIMGKEPLDPAKIAPPEWLSAVQEEIRRTEYRITEQQTRLVPRHEGNSTTGELISTYQASNEAHGFESSFAQSGLSLTLRRGHKWELALVSFGKGKREAVREARLVAADNRIEYQRGTLKEWYVNDERGIKQGLTLNARPSASPKDTGGQPLVFEFATSGLSASLIDTDTVVLKSPAGEDVLRYSGLLAFDATGKELPSRMEVGDSHIRLVIDDSNARYPIVIDPRLTSPNWTASSSQFNSFFGWSVNHAGDARLRWMISMAMAMLM